MKRALDVDAHRLVEDAEVSEEGVVVGQEFGAWIETLILLAEVRVFILLGIHCSTNCILFRQRQG